MVSIYDIKPRFQAVLRPLCGRLAAAGITANELTLFAALWSVVHGAAIAIWPAEVLPLLLLPLTLLARMALNAIDGMLAREHGQKSKLGAVLNELGDVVSDAALYLPFALIAGLSAWAAVLAVVLAIIAEMTGVLAISISGSRRYEGPMGKSDRAFAYGLLAFLLGVGLGPGIWAPVYQWLVVALLVVTIVNRARKSLQMGKLS